MSVAENRRFLLALSFAGCAAADSGDDFSNNLFSDLAPLLALFGERVIMQFMSQSMGWADNFILAMAPLGIITVIVSAIRVSGPSWLRAIIGRSRENLAVAEAELMSSTSKEVCEVWNGHEVVRCMGLSPVSEFICLISTDTPSTGNGRPVDTTVGTVSVGKAVERGYLEEFETNLWDGIKRMIHRKHSPGDLNAEQGQGTRDPSAPQIIIASNMVADAPNIALNSHNQLGRGELLVVAVIGTILQLGVLTYSGFATYYPSLRLAKDGGPVADYAFPCTAAGTLTLVAGMLICSHVVESSTEEKRYKPGRGKEIRMVWLQRAETVSDQVFNSFAVFASDKRALIMTSHRVPEESRQGTILALKTVLGAVVGLCGFVVQFIGLRGMHWSASVAQLGAVLVMTGLRAWVRRGLAEPPRYHPLSRGFELEWFAIKLGDLNNAPWWDTPEPESKVKNCKNSNWGIMTGGSPEIHEKLRQTSKNGTSKAYTVMKIRIDLGQLYDWRGPASAEAISLARAIEVTMNALFASSPTASFVWSLKAHSAESNAQSVSLHLKQQNGSWKASAEEIEAALSLWLFSVSDQEQGQNQQVSPGTPRSEDDARFRAKGSPAKRSLRLLGSYTQRLRRHLQLLMPDGAARVIEVQTTTQLDDSSRIQVEPHRVVGSGYSATHHPVGYRIWKSSPTPPKDKLDKHVGEGEARNLFLATESHIPLNLLYAQDMFSAFMWAVAKTLTHHIKGADIQPNDTRGIDAWRSFTLRIDSLSKMAREIQSTGFGNLEDVYLSIIPPLSVEHKLLQSDTIIDLAREHARRQEKLGHWTEAGLVYLWLFQTVKIFPEQSRIATRATAELTEYLRLVTAVIELRKAQQYEERDIRDLKELKSKLDEKLETADRAILSSLIRLYEAQGRPWNGDLVGLGSAEDTIYSKVFNFKELHRLAQSSDWKDTEAIKGALRDGEDVNVTDIYNWTPLHYAAAKGSTETAVELLKRRADVNARNALEWTPLHYACQAGKARIVQNLIREGAELDVHGRDGLAPLHCATMNGHLQVVKRLIEAGAALDVLDTSGNTPLLWAAYKGHRGIVEYLWQDANKKLRDHNGRTALHLAAIAGMAEVVSQLVGLGADKEAKSRAGQTPLHFAASELVASRLIEEGAKKEAKDDNSQTPLHFASATGHERVARLLVEGGADKEAKDHTGQTPLHSAAAAGHVNVVRLLVEKNANLEAKDRTDQTPLHFASATGHERVARLLVELGADKEAQDHTDQTPLHSAAVIGHADVVRLLIKLGADIEAKDNLGQAPLHSAAVIGHADVVRLLIEKGADMEAKDGDGQTPLYIAAIHENADIIRLLIEKGANKEAKDSKGRTPLLFAAITGHADAVRLLIELGADMEAKDNLGRTPLHSAAVIGHADVVRLLIELGAEAKDNLGRTPLHSAAVIGHADVVRLLIELGADMEAKDSDGRTPLYIAAIHENADIIRLLIEKGANKEAKDSEGQTPLLFAAITGHADAVRLLIEKGGNKEAKDNLGRTPLDCAKATGHKDIARLLLELRAE